MKKQWFAADVRLTQGSKRAKSCQRPFATDGTGSGGAKDTPKGRTERTLVLAAPLLLSAVTVVISTGSAAAACMQSGNVVTCSDATNTGFGTGAENNLSITVQPNASIAVGAGQLAINVASGNTALNNGTITVGDGGEGMQGIDSNSFTNAGTMSV